MSRSVLFGVVSNGSQVATRLVTIPIVIHHLGLDGYGIWNTIMMTASYMRFGSVGVKTAFQKYVAESMGNGNYKTASQLLSTGCAMLLGLSVLGLIPAALFSRAIVVHAGVPPEFQSSAAVAVGLLALIMAVANVGSVFEAIVMGGQRVDLCRKFNTCLAVIEAVAIVIAMRLGFGLAAMAGIMGLSELIYIVCCYVASKRIVPEVRVGLGFVTKDVVYELIRFAGSYQLVNVFEVVYASTLPVIMLRTFGANAAGIYALVTRVVASASMILESFLPPLLSGAAMVYATASPQRMTDLMRKAFKVTLVMSLLPLGFISVFGSTMTYAWTGQADPSFPMVFALVCFKALVSSLSLLTLVLYRTSGKAVLDNVRQVIRLGAIVAIAAFASRLGFYGILAAVAAAELIGLIFMLFALGHTFERFSASVVVPDALKLTAAASLIIGVALVASRVTLPAAFEGRQLALLSLVQASVVCLLVAYPIARWTGSVTLEERSELLSAVLPKWMSREATESGGA